MSKLYTEEQVITFAIKVLSDYEINGTFYNREKLKEALDVTPIELPSDEEIEWIDIKDELPPSNKYVLLYLPMYDNIAMGVQRDNEIGIIGDFMGEPTHWRLLPNSPKEQILKQKK